MIDLLSKYALNDGEIHSLKLEYASETTQNSMIIDLKVKKYISKNKFVPCLLRLIFSELIELSIYEDFGTEGNYSDITILFEVKDEYYFSFDPYDNKNKQNDKDNFIIKARKLEIIELN